MRMRLPSIRRQASQGIYGGFGSKPAQAVFRPRVGSHVDDRDEDAVRSARKGGKFEPSAKKHRWWKHRRTRRQSPSELTANGICAMTVGLLLLWLADGAAGRAFASGPAKDAGVWFFLMSLGGLMTVWGGRNLWAAWKQWRKTIRQRPIDQDTFD